MKSKLYTTVVLIIGIVVVLNLLANEFHFRWDLTEDHQYTLSRATKDILQNLEEPVTVKAYFSKNVPPNVVKTKQDFQDLLIEYANLADGQLVYEFTNPNEKESEEQEAMQHGIRPVMISVREKDQVKQQKAFLGATVLMGDKEEAIPVVQPGAAMEYALSTAIKKLSVENKPVIGFIQGHGEPSLNEMPQAQQQLDVLYQSQEVTMTDSTDLPSTIKTLVLIRPTDSIPASHLAKLDAFLSQGGRLLLAVNRVQGDLRNANGYPVNTGLEKWLNTKGVDLPPTFIVDAQCGSVTVQSQGGGFFALLQQNISFPFLPVISNFAEHPITSGLESVLLQFASPVTFTGDSTRHFKPIAFTTELSNTLPAPTYFDINKEWAKEDFTQQNITVAATLDGGNAGKMVIIGDGDFPINGAGEQARQLPEDNINLLSNAIDWLSDDTGLIQLRTKGVTSRPIRELDDSTRTWLKYINFLLPILLVIGYGVVRAQNSRIRRLRRSSENYEAD